MVIADPTIPRRDRAILLRYPEVLIPARQRLADRVRPATAAFDALITALRDRRGYGVLARLLVRAADALSEVPYSAGRLARLHHGRYLVGADVDAAGRALVDRAYAAVQAVLGSRVNRLGLIDAVANKVVLRRELWEIAMMTYRQSALRRVQRSVAGAEMTPALAAVTGPQREALDRSVAAAARRVERLEEYARRVRSADSALLARRLLAANDAYRDLLAQVDDERAAGALGGRSRRVEESLTAHVLAAVEAGEALALPHRPDVSA